VSQRIICQVAALLAVLVGTGCSPARFAKPVERLTTPPAGQCLINVHYTPSAPKTAGFDLFDGEGRLVGKLRHRTLVQLVNRPGTTWLMARDYNTAVIRIETLPGMVYDVHADYSSWTGVGGLVGWGTGVQMILEPVPPAGELRQRIEAEEGELIPVAIDRADPEAAVIESQCRQENLASLLLARQRPDAVHVLRADQHRQ
jgi:hypothetical protein